MEVLSGIWERLKECFSNKEKLGNKQIICYLKLFALILILLLLSMILISDSGKNYILISALAILISALLASYSMMFSIENTNENERLKRDADTKINILYLIQNLNDILSVLNAYKSIDIGDLKINTHNTLLLILEKKLNSLEDKEIINNLSDEEIDLLLLVRLRLYENVGILYNYTQGIIVDDPKKFNNNIRFIVEKSDLLIQSVAKNNNVHLQKYGEK